MKTGKEQKEIGAGNICWGDGGGEGEVSRFNNVSAGHSYSRLHLSFAPIIHSHLVFYFLTWYSFHHHKQTSEMLSLSRKLGVLKVSRFQTIEPGYVNQACVS